MELGLGWGQATFRMLGTVSTLRHRVLKFLTRGPARVTLGSRAAFADAVLLVCVLVFGGLLVLGSVVMLLSFVTAAPPPSTVNTRPQLDIYPAPAGAGNDLWVDDPRTGQPSMRP